AVELLGLDVEVHVSRPPSSIRALSPRRESLTLRLRAERLDLLLGVGGARVVRRKLDEALVRLDGDLVVAGVLRRLREEERVRRLGRLPQRDDALVGLHQLLRGRLARAERGVEAL